MTVTGIPRFMGMRVTATAADAGVTLGNGRCASLARTRGIPDGCGVSRQAAESRVWQICHTLQAAFCRPQSPRRRFQKGIGESVCRLVRRHGRRAFFPRTKMAGRAVAAGNIFSGEENLGTIYDSVANWRTPVMPVAGKTGHRCRARMAGPYRPYGGLDNPAPERRRP